MVDNLNVAHLKYQTHIILFLYLDTVINIYPSVSVLIENQRIIFIFIRNVVSVLCAGILFILYKEVSILIWVCTLGTLTAEQ